MASKGTSSGATQAAAQVGGEPIVIAALGLTSTRVERDRTGGGRCTAGADGRKTHPQRYRAHQPICVRARARRPVPRKRACIHGITEWQWSPEQIARAIITKSPRRDLVPHRASAASSASCAYLRRGARAAQPQGARRLARRSDLDGPGEERCLGGDRSAASSAVEELVEPFVTKHGASTPAGCSIGDPAGRLVVDPGSGIEMVDGASPPRRVQVALQTPATRLERRSCADFPR